MILRHPSIKTKTIKIDFLLLFVVKVYAFVGLFVGCDCFGWVDIIIFVM